MSTALSSGVITLLLWLVVVLAVFLVVGIGVAWAVGRVIPKNQERLPRKHWMMATIILTFLIGLHAGLNVGIPQGLLAFGDSMVKHETVVLSPLPHTEAGQNFWATAEDSYNRLRTAIDKERNWMRSEGIWQYAIGHLILDALYEPTLVVVEVGEKYWKQQKRSNEQIVSAQRLQRAWVSARPDLDEVALRRIAASILIGTLYMLLLFVVGVLLVALSWKKMYASARRRRETEKRRRRRQSQ